MANAQWKKMWDELALAGTPEEQQMTRWVICLMMWSAIQYGTDYPVKRSLGDLVDYLKDRDLPMSEGELSILIDSAVQKNSEIFGREEEEETIYYVTSKRRCFQEKPPPPPPVVEPPDFPRQRPLPKEVVDTSLRQETSESPAPSVEAKESHPTEGSLPRKAQFTLTEEALSRGWIKITPGMQKMIDHLGLRGIVEFEAYGVYIVSTWLNAKRRRFEGAALLKWFQERQLLVGDTVYVKFPQRSGQPLRLSSWLEEEGAGPVEGGDEQGRRVRIHLRERIHRALLSAGVMTVQAIADALGQQLGWPVRYGSVEATLVRESHLFAAWGRGHWGLREWGEDWRDHVDPQALLMRIEEEDLVFETIRAGGRWMSEPEIAREIAARFLITSDIVLETSFLDPSDERLVRGGELWGLWEWERKPLSVSPWFLRALRMYPELRPVVDKWLAGWASRTVEELVAGV